VAAPKDLAAIPGTPETALEPEQLGALPDEAPPAPWELAASALVWVGRLRPGASARLPGGVRRGGRPLAAVGAFVRYERTPVGPYDELLAGVVLAGRRGIATHVPFMAVDSEASVVGGRANWALPKVRARFEGDLREVRARGDGWSVAVEVRPRRPALRFRAPVSLVQVWPDGAVRGASGRLTGRARPARIKVGVSGSEPLRAVLPEGALLGVVVEHARGSLGAARL
jgi:Acetoacetate decarboxylase (ADC)